MAPEIISPAFKEIIRGVAGAEGPVFNKSDRFFMVAPFDKDSSGPAGSILEIDLDSGKSTIICRPNINGHAGIPAGLQCDRENCLWIADMRLGLLKLHNDGKLEQIKTVDNSSQPMQGCNDLIYDYEGNLWITAPAGPIAPAPFTRSAEEPFGSVYCYTKSGEMIKIDTGYYFSNGIAVQHESSKPTKLIVAETVTKKLWAYDIRGPGRVENKSVWATMEGEIGDVMCGPDGMDFDLDGNLLVTNQKASHLDVFPPQGGDLIARIKCPFSNPSNVHFKPGTSEVYVSEHTNDGLWTFNWRAKGMPQYCEL